MERTRTSELTEIVGFQYCQLKAGCIDQEREYLFKSDNSGRQLVYCRAMKITITYDDGTTEEKHRIEPVRTDTLMEIDLDGIEL